MRLGLRRQIIAVVLTVGILAVKERECAAMQDMEVILDGRPIVLNPAVRLDGDDVWVPAQALGEVIGAEAKEVNGQLALCKGDLCLPLTADECVDGDVYIALEDVAEPLGLSWQIEAQTLRLTRGGAVDTGLGIGKWPPEFTLPDLYSGEPVSLSSYRGKKAVFYMWASW